MRRPCPPLLVLRLQPVLSTIYCHRAPFLILFLFLYNGFLNVKQSIFISLREVECLEHYTVHCGARGLHPKEGLSVVSSLGFRLYLVQIVSTICVQPLQRACLQQVLLFDVQDDYDPIWSKEVPKMSTVQKKVFTEVL